MSELAYRMMMSGGTKPTSQGNGTQTATVGTEHTLLDVAIAGSFVLEVDLFNMHALDYTILRVYAITLTGGTRRVAWDCSYSGVQSSDNMIAVALPVANELTDAGSLRFTLQQLYGTSRDYPWKVMKLSA